MRSTRIAITLLFFADGLLLGSWASRIPSVQAQAGLNNTALGIALFASSVGALIAMPIAGRLCERVGSAHVTVAALVGGGVCLFGASSAGGLVSVAVGLLGFGAGFGSVNVAANAQGIALERRWGRTILSSFHAAFSVGGLTGSVVGAIAARWGLTPRAHIGAIVILVVVLALALRGKLLPAVAGEVRARRTMGRAPRVLLLLGAAAFCTLLAEGAVADWSATFLAHSVGATAAVAGLGYGTFSLAMAASRLLGDRLVQWLGAVTLARTGGLVAAFGLGTALLVGVTPIALAGFAAMGTGLGVVVPVLFRAAGSAAGASASAGVATVSSLGWLGFLAGPPAIGFAAGAVGLRIALAIVVVALLALVFLAGSADPRRGGASDAVSAALHRTAARSAGGSGSSGECRAARG
jgi:MFS family permease